MQKLPDLSPQLSSQNRTVFQAYPPCRRLYDSSWGNFWSVQREILKNAKMVREEGEVESQQVIYPYYPGPRVKIKISKPHSGSF